MKMRNIILLAGIVGAGYFIYVSKGAYAPDRIIDDDDMPDERKYLKEYNPELKQYKQGNNFKRKFGRKQESGFDKALHKMEDSYVKVHRPLLTSKNDYYIDLAQHGTKDVSRELLVDGKHWLSKNLHLKKYWV